MFLQSGIQADFSAFEWRSISGYTILFFDWSWSGPVITLGANVASNPKVFGKTMTLFQKKNEVSTKFQRNQKFLEENF